MLFSKLWSSGPQEYQKPLLEEAPESSSGASEASSSSNWYFQSLTAGTNTTSSESTAVCSRLDHESALYEPRPIPAGVAYFDPVRFGPSSQPSEELLQLAATFAEDRHQYEKDLQEHEQLVGRLTRRDWKLLRWSDRRLIKLAALEGLGPASLHTAASNPELKNLLLCRQRAWISAHQITKQWQSLVLHRGLLLSSFFSLWPTGKFQDHWDLSLDTSPERKCNEAYVDALGMVPNAPEFHVLYQDLPRWAKAGSKSAKLTTKSTHMMQ